MFQIALCFKIQIQICGKMPNFGSSTSLILISVICIFGISFAQSPLWVADGISTPNDARMGCWNSTTQQMNIGFLNYENGLITLKIIQISTEDPINSMEDAKIISTQTFQYKTNSQLKIIQLIDLPNFPVDSQETFIILLALIENQTNTTNITSNSGLSLIRIGCDGSITQNITFPIPESAKEGSQFTNESIACQGFGLGFVAILARTNLNETFLLLSHIDNEVLSFSIDYQNDNFANGMLLGLNCPTVEDDLHWFSLSEDKKIMFYIGFDVVHFQMVIGTFKI